MAALLKRSLITSLGAVRLRSPGGPALADNMGLFIASVVGVFVLILMAIGRWLRSAGRHVRYEADPGHDRAGEREGRWYPLR
jgi:hypothetical protein